MQPERNVSEKSSSQEVAIYGRSGTSDKDGRFEIVVPAGSGRFSANAPACYETLEPVPFTARAGDDRLPDVVLHPAAHADAGANGAKRP